MKKFLSAVLAGAMVLSVASVSLFAAQPAKGDIIELSDFSGTSDATSVINTRVYPDSKVTYVIDSQFADGDHYKVKFKKNEGSKMVNAIALVEKNLDGNAANGRENGVEVKLNDDYTDKETKVKFTVTFTLTQKGVDAGISGTAGDKTEFVGTFWVSNEEQKSDQDYNAGTGGVIYKPVNNENNEIIWQNANDEIAKLVLSSDSSTNKLFPKLSTKWDNALYAEKFADQDAYIFNFVAAPGVSDTSRGTLTIFNPFLNEDGDSDTDEEEIVVYQLVDGELQDVTAKFTIGENEDGDSVLTTKTRALGTYIVAQKAAAVAAEEVPAEDGKEVPDTGR